MDSSEPVVIASTTSKLEHLAGLSFRIEEIPIQLQTATTIIFRQTAFIWEVIDLDVNFAFNVNSLPGRFDVIPWNKAKVISTIKKYDFILFWKRLSTWLVERDQARLNRFC